LLLPYCVNPFIGFAGVVDIRSSVSGGNFYSIQLNRLNWRDYLNQANPVAAALMSKMKIAQSDRPKVKAECLRVLVTLRLNPAKTRLISRFVDTYLRLNSVEEQVFQTEVDKMELVERETIMQITTSWEEKGIEKGIEQGARQEARSLILRLLTRRVGQLPEAILAQVNELPIEQLEALGEALLDFVDLSDLQAWLASEVV
jgi:hypothetical protein